MKSKLVKSITVVDHEGNEDRRTGPKVFVDLEIGKEEQSARESPEAWGREGAWPMVAVCGHDKEEA